VRERDQQDFEDFFVANWGAIFRTAYLLTGDHHLSQDLSQIAFSKAYRAWDRVRGMDHPRAYVRKTLVNETVSWRRRRSSGEVPTLDLPAVHTPGPDASLPGSLALWAAVLHLPPRQRAVIVLRYYEDLSESEIADELGIALGTVKSTASAARAALATRLNTDNEVSSRGGA